MNKLKNISLSVQQRLLLAFLSMSILVLIASGAGILFSRSVENAIAATRVGLDQIQTVNNIQKEWQAIAETVDTLFLTRRVDNVQNEIDASSQALSEQLINLQLQPLGIRENTIRSNQAILRELLQINTIAITTVDEIVRLAAEGNWSIARDLRELTFTTQRTDFDNRLQQMNTNVRDDVSYLFENAKRAQEYNRLITMLIALSAFIIAILLTIGGTRSIVLPVNQLTQAVQRVTLGDFQPVPPLPRKDEIGNLSRSFTLMTEWLRDSYERLEERVAERTAELERQSLQISVAAEIARDVSTARSPDKLLTRAVDLVAQRFGYYQASIFLIDEASEYAVLRATSNPLSDEPPLTEQKVKVGDPGIIGQVARTGEPKAVLEMEPPILPAGGLLVSDNLSEVVLPMKIGSLVIGVLDVKSHTGDAFRDSDQYVLQILADLLAVAIHNAQLNAKVEESLNELEILYGQYSKKSWEKAQHLMGIKGYRYDRSGVHAITQQQKSATAEDIPPASIPLIIRGQEIGTLRVWPGENRLLAEDIRALEELGLRISQTMENARLFSDSQQRAENERIVRQVSAHMRETLDIQNVLRVAVEDIYQVLNLSELTIDLSPDGELIDEDRLVDPMR